MIHSAIVKGLLTIDTSLFPSVLPVQVRMAAPASLTPVKRKLPARKDCRFFAFFYRQEVRGALLRAPNAVALVLTPAKSLHSVCLCRLFNKKEGEP